MNKMRVKLKLQSNQNIRLCAVKKNSLEKICSLAIANIKSFLFSTDKIQILHRLSQSKIVGLECSPDWGVIILGENGQVALEFDDSIEVLVAHVKTGKFLLEKKLWKLKELIFFEPSLLTKLRTDVANIIEAKLLLEKELKILVSHTEKTRELYELIENQREYAIICNKLHFLHQHELKTISQLKSLQLTQDEVLQNLLISLNVINFQQEHLKLSFDYFESVLTEATQKNQDNIAYINKDMVLLPSSIIRIRD